MSIDKPLFHETPSQTAGPYVHIGCAPQTCGIDMRGVQDLGSIMRDEGTEGERITVSGHIYDGAGAPLTDALVEVWQADHQGKFTTVAIEGGGTSFRGWGRQITDLETGAFAFETIKPGAVGVADGTRQAPHLALWIVARGINLGLHTRMYFPQETAANAICPVLTCVPEARRDTLIAERQTDRYIFDIHLQGARETVFFDV